VGHAITALIVRDPCDSDAAREWDVVVVPLHQQLHLAHVDHYYSAYWQARRGESTLLDVPEHQPLWRAAGIPGKRFGRTRNDCYSPPGRTRWVSGLALWMAG
jgi:hypothetical protein